MKRIATLGILALTVTVNLSPLNVHAAGVSQYYQCNDRSNTVTISSNSNCNLNDIQSKLQDLGINANDVKWSSTVNPQNCPNKTTQPEQSYTNAVTDNSVCKESVQNIVKDVKQQLPEAVKAQVENATDDYTANCNKTSANTANTCPTNTNTANTNTANTNTANTNTANTNTANTNTANTNTANTNTAKTNTANTNTAKTNTTNTNTVNTNTAKTNTANTNTANTNTAKTDPTNTKTTDNSTKDTSNDTTSTSTQNTDSNSNTNVSYAQQVVNLVNVERAKEGLPALTVDQNVQKAAMIRANEIQSKFEHVRPNGSSFSTVLKENGVTYRGAGENIAWGQKTPEEVVTAWMNSPGHRANIMNKNFVHIGVGNTQNSSGTQYWTQLFTY